jgi:hypothetical protein
MCSDEPGSGNATQLWGGIKRLMTGGSDELRNTPHIVRRTTDCAVVSPFGFKESAIRATCNQQVCCLELYLSSRPRQTVRYSRGVAASDVTLGIFLLA